MIYAIGSVNPKPVSRFVPETPPALDQLITQAIRKDRETRYQSFEDIRFDITPIRQELIAQFIEKAVADAKGLLADGYVDDAQAIVRDVLRRDPGNQTGRRMREEIQRHNKDRTIRERAGKLAATARQFLASGEFPKAIETLEEAQKLDSANSEIGPLLAQAKAAKMKVDQLAHLMDAARRELQSQNLTGAYRIAIDCLDRSPGYQEAADLLAVIREQRQRRDRERRIEDVLGRARTLAEAGSYDDALKLLEDLAADYPEAPHIGIIAERLRTHRRRELERKLAVELARAKALIDLREWQQAQSVLEPVVRENPSHDQAATWLGRAREELREARKTKEIEGFTAEARRLCDEEQFESAWGVVEQALRQYPRDGRLERQAREITEKRVRHERNKSIQAAVRAAEELRKAKRFRDAITGLHEAIRLWDSTELLELREQIAADWRLEQRAEAVSNARRIAESLAAQGKWREALQSAIEAMRSYPGSPELIQLQWELESGFRRYELDRKEAEIGAAIDAGGFDQAIRLTDAALASDPGHGKFAALKEKAVEARLRRERDDDRATALELAGFLRAAGDLEGALQSLEPFAGDGHAQVARVIEDVQREAREKAAAEALELARIEREAREKAEAEARERARIEKEAREKAEREAREKAEREVCTIYGGRVAQTAQRASAF